MVCHSAGAGGASVGVSSGSTCNSWAELKGVGYCPGANSSTSLTICKGALGAGAWGDVVANLLDAALDSGLKLNNQLIQNAIDYFGDKELGYLVDEFPANSTTV